MKLDEYLESLVGRSDKTIRLHTKVLHQYYKYIDDDEQLLDVYTAQRFLKDCSKRGLENISVATYSIILRSFLEYIGVPEREVNEIRLPRIGFKVKQAIDEEYWERFLRQPKTLRNMVIAYVLLYGACRVGELRRIIVGDIDWESNMIVIKGARDAKVAGSMVLNGITMNVLREYIKTEKLKKTDRLITLSERRIEQLVKQWAKQANIPHAEKITPHSLRRSLGKAFYKRSGKDIEKTRIALRHQNISSTQHYLSIEEEEVKKDYKDMFG